MKTWWRAQLHPRNWLAYLLFDLVILALWLLLTTQHPAPADAALRYFTHCAAGLIPAGDGLTQGWACHN